MIVEEDKKEEKNEKLLVDLCECYLLFYIEFPSLDLILTCVPCLLKATLKKEENDETQKEVEIALLALSRINRHYFLRQELYLKEITEIIEHQQKHRNLSQLAYQSTWKFFIYRYFNDYFLKGNIMNKLHFGREAARELEELIKCVDWNRKNGEEGGKEAKEELILLRCLQTIVVYFCICKLENEENEGLIKSIVKVLRAVKDNRRDISDQCISSLRNAAENRVVKVEYLLKGGAVEAVLEGMQRPTLNECLRFDCLQFFMNVSERLNEKVDNKTEEEERKATKRKIIDKMEEEGYEDTITSFHKTLKIFN
eukprot:MONOS_7984.1-p1 / transcript=MONOS_7984.1 / gene=MONOS_7984 / organism=Monocercomonoides_exilis_PA203 / gene_product=unspecified product / transcript_product=unspecified product / location=Mono_scaffold00289:33874-34863(+) / protein_length=311 / sequence_SO=supercontig / SO=protein_coding / is_pseudo=false